MRRLYRQKRPRPKSTPVRLRKDEREKIAEDVKPKTLAEVLHETWIPSMDEPMTTS